MSKVTITPTYDLAYGSALQVVVYKLAVDAGYTYSNSQDKKVQAVTIPEDYIKWYAAGRRSEEWILEKRDTLAYVTFDDTTLYVIAFSNSFKEAALFNKEILEWAKPITDVEEDVIPVSFWSLAPNGPQSVSRSIYVPTWEEVTYNYNELTKEALEKMMTPEYRPTRSGQLFLWHGKPGTGKTTALRALGRSWKDWLELHYITDPEKFFGESAHYMLRVLIDEPEEEDKWRLFILEDTGELISADAKRSTGQGLSRLLNTVDGLIGQGLRFLVLITTNEEVGKLHSAIARPGRCAANIRFDELTEVETQKWAEHNGVTLDPDKTYATIADLYDVFHEQITTATKLKKVGFA